MFPTEAFETATKRKILRVLAEQNKRFTIPELAEMCHRSQPTISRALQDADRHPFVEKDTIPGSKRLTVRLVPESRYTGAIRDFFEVEYDRERQNGTVPVDVWNLLEDLTARFRANVDGFVELFLFGSYANGDYYAGSDIDLLLVHTPADDIERTIDRQAAAVEDDRLQVIQVEISDRALDRTENDQLLDEIRSKSPVQGVDVLIPLAGEVVV